MSYLLTYYVSTFSTTNPDPTLSAACATLHTFAHNDTLAKYHEHSLLFPVYWFFGHMHRQETIKTTVPLTTHTGTNKMIETIQCTI